jgi:hypothetical protein
METGRDDHRPFLDIDICRKPDGSQWAIRFIVNPRTLTSTSVPTYTTTSVPTNRLYVPCWCTGPDSFVTGKVYTVNWSFSGPLPGTNATTTGRSDGFSVHRRESHRHRRNLSRSLSCPTSTRLSTALAGCYRHNIKSVVSFGL